MPVPCWECWRYDGAGQLEVWRGEGPPSPPRESVTLARAGPMLFSSVSSRGWCDRGCGQCCAVCGAASSSRAESGSGWRRTPCTGGKRRAEWETKRKDEICGH